MFILSWIFKNATIQTDILSYNFTGGSPDNPLSVYSDRCGFSLALIDYYKDTEYLYNPLKKILLNTGSTLFILFYGFRKTKASLLEVFPLKIFNPLVVIPLIAFSGALTICLKL